MGRFMVGADRSQPSLFPACVDDWIDADNPVCGSTPSWMLSTSPRWALQA
jgi:hypothetical protein